MSWKKARDPKGAQTGGCQEEEEGVGPGRKALGRGGRRERRGPC